MLARYAAVAVVARVADTASITALVLAALERTGSPATGGILAAAVTVPHILAGPLAGALADRVRPPALLYVPSFLVFGLALVAVNATVGETAAIVPAVFAFVAGCVGPLLSGGMTGLLGGLMPRKALPRAFAIDTGTYNVAGLSGPVLVALIAAQASASAALLAIAGMSVLAGAAFLAIPRPHADADPATPLSRRSLIAGLTVILRNPPLRGTTLATTFASIGKDSVLPLAVAVLALEIGQSASSGALLLSAHAAGALVGAIMVTVVPIPDHRVQLVLYGCLGWMAAVFAVTAFVTSFPLLIALFAASGLCNGPLLTATFYVRNAFTPAGLRTQVFTTAVGLRAGLSALGAVVAGGMADSVGAVGLLLMPAISHGLAIPLGLLASRTKPAQADAEESPADGRAADLSGPPDRTTPAAAEARSAESP